MFMNVNNDLPLGLLLSHQMSYDIATLSVVLGQQHMHLSPGSLVEIQDLRRCPRLSGSELTS